MIKTPLFTSNKIRFTSEDRGLGSRAWTSTRAFESFFKRWLLKSNSGVAAHLSISSLSSGVDPWFEARNRGGELTHGRFAELIGISAVNPAGERQKAILLIDSWLNDQSGYDEETWPKLKQALDEDRLSDRKLFDD